MSGRMIILPHKSWHVYNSANIIKVKEDERKHEEEEKEKQRKVDEAVSASNVRSLRVTSHHHVPPSCALTTTHARARVAYSITET